MTTSCRCSYVCVHLMNNFEFIPVTFVVVSSYRRQAFSVVGPTMWNSRPKKLRDPVHTTSIFGCLLMTFLFSEY